MADSLRDQLLKSGIVKQLKQDKPMRPAVRPSTPGIKGKPQQRTHSARQGEEMDLAKAYALRAQTEAAERKRAEQEAAERARLKRERKEKVQKVLQGNVLNKADADQVRHFEYGGKIRRIYVDSVQLADLNTGKLGIVQNEGRYLLVSQSVAEQVRELEPRLVALLADPSNPLVDEDGIPADLMW